jgi:hypothetical protein
MELGPKQCPGITPDMAICIEYPVSEELLSDIIVNEG